MIKRLNIRLIWASSLRFLNRLDLLLSLCQVQLLEKFGKPNKSSHFYSLKTFKLKVRNFNEIPKTAPEKIIVKLSCSAS